VSLKTAIGKATPALAKKLMTTLPFRTCMMQIADGKYTKYPTKVDPKFATEIGVAEVYLISLNLELFLL